MYCFVISGCRRPNCGCRPRIQARVFVVHGSPHHSVAVRDHVCAIQSGIVRDGPHVATPLDRYHRSRKLDSQPAQRRRLLTARERLSNKVFAIMCNRIQADDPARRSSWRGSPEGNYAAAGHGAGRWGGAPGPASLLHRFLTCVSPHRCPTAHGAATIDTWWPKTSLSSPPASPTPRTERCNRLLETGQTRVGCGFRSRHDSTRARDPLHPQTAGRSPGSTVIAPAKSKSRCSSCRVEGSACEFDSRTRRRSARVMSNHPDLAAGVRAFGVPFVHIPVQLVNDL